MPELKAKSLQNPWSPLEWTPEEAAEIASWKLKKECGPRTWIYGDWYNNPNIPVPWSTNWERWDSLCLYEENVGGKPKIDVLFKDVCDVPSKVEPLAYHTTAGDDSSYSRLEAAIIFGKKATSLSIGTGLGCRKNF
ncbi:hypothetical protein DFH08DRAFT_822162 [Mycena albidolilacea]|uniref:Uncharacterized protein n=1 Tax=Mycena albidolilacea TaxID=1033008 RepID=A0AAD6Z9F8_9AGAR|nr:hypothetical protein DFH08DRAFT_822162 [Mycena albidolilacea]